MSCQRTTWGRVVYQADRLAWCVFVVVGAVCFAPIFAALRLRELWPDRRTA